MKILTINMDYTKGYIYKIYSLDDKDEIYIGSTSEALRTRLRQHIYSYKKYKENGGSFITVYKIFEKYGTKNIKIEKVDSIKYVNKRDLLNLEGEYQKKCKCVNKVINGQTIIKSNNKFEGPTNIPMEDNVFKNFLYYS